MPLPDYFDIHWYSINTPTVTLKRGLKVFVLLGNRFIYAGILTEDHFTTFGGIRVNITKTQITGTTKCGSIENIRKECVFPRHMVKWKGERAITEEFRWVENNGID